MIYVSDVLASIVIFFLVEDCPVVSVIYDEIEAFLRLTP